MTVWHQKANILCIRHRPYFESNPKLLQLFHRGKTSADTVSVKKTLSNRNDHRAILILEYLPLDAKKPFCVILLLCRPVHGIQKRDLLQSIDSVHLNPKFSVFRSFHSPS